MKDTSSPDMTIKVVGYQWKWRYDYLGENVSFYSDLSTPREQMENSVPPIDTPAMGEPSIRLFDQHHRPIDSR